MSKKTTIVLLLFLVSFIGFLFSGFTLAFVNLPAEYWYEITSYGGEKPKNVTLILPIPHIGGKPVVNQSSTTNVSIIDTPYGKMLKVELEEMDVFPVVISVTGGKTIDIMDTNVTLSPLLEKEFISRTENEEELSEKYKIKVPVYAEFEGNSTIFVEFSIHSGFKALPLFFTYTIPWEPKYGWKAYTGGKTFEFKIEKEGWQVVEGEERARIIFQ